MPRAQNAHAHVNAGFLFKLGGSGKVLTKPNIIIGGINANFVSDIIVCLFAPAFKLRLTVVLHRFSQLHASETENFLVGKSIFDKDVVEEALVKLDGEMKPDHVLPDYSPQFRKTLAEGLLFKVLAIVLLNHVDQSNDSYYF